MAKREPKPLESFEKRGRPARTPEERDQELINLAMDRAEQQLRDGTASSQVIVHFLKLGTSQNKLETEKLRHENDLLEAKTASLNAQARSDEMFAEAMNAFKRYSGARVYEDGDEYYED